MRYIAAPWREAYVRGGSEPAGCFLCRAARAKDDERSHVLCRGRHAFVVLNKYPYLPGHLMIAPFRHLAAFENASEALTREMTVLLQRSLKALKTAYAPHGFNTGMNLGRSAGAGVAGHFHYHVVPRWTGDSNFMPLLAGTRVVLEDIDTTYGRLRPLFRAGRTRSRA